MNKVIVIVGPTAVGKTKISIELAKKYGIDVISGDSVAVYKRLDIGSAKPSIEEQDGVYHHLLDVLEPHEQYSVADFQHSARKILDSKPLSIICGGTGLYIQAALFDYDFSAQKRDSYFEQKFVNYTNEQLYELLISQDSNINKDIIHPNNRKRILRALEILEDEGRSIHSYNNKKTPLYDAYIVYLRLERIQLYDRINKRVDKMIADGLEQEVKKLSEEGIYPTGIGYREWVDFFNGNKSRDEVIEKIKQNTRHLAKRQETWFKNQMDSHFYEVDLENIENTIKKIEKDIDEWMVSK